MIAFGYEKDNDEEKEQDINTLLIIIHSLILLSVY